MHACEHTLPSTRLHAHARVHANAGAFAHGYKHEPRIHVYEQLQYPHHQAYNLIRTYYAAHVRSLGPILTLASSL